MSKDKCRAFLSPVFKNSGTYEPEDDNDEFLIYRCNMGVVSLNLPMIYQKSVEENRKFYEVLDEYMDMIRGIHKRTINYLKKLKASCNPLCFMEEGLDGGNLKPDDSIAPVLKYSTISYGYGGLHELSMLATGKPLHEDQSFALDTLKHIADRVNMYKKKDGILYALYGSPGESWLPLACEQFIKKYGEKPGIAVKGGYFSNSFHCHVTAEVNPIEKMDIESKFWAYPNGGKITHILINDIQNTEGIISLIRYGMSKGLYLGVNHKANYCTECGSHWIGDDTVGAEDDHCPECGSSEIVKIRRMNGYLSFTRTKNGDCRFHDGKVKEISERKNM